MNVESILYAYRISQVSANRPRIKPDAADLPCTFRTIGRITCKKFAESRQIRGRFGSKCELLVRLAKETPAADDKRSDRSILSRLIERMFRMFANF